MEVGLTSCVSGIAVRISAHPLVAALCQAWGGPLVSTSANLAGEPPARSREELERVVTRGAQLLLSEELKHTLADENDD